ncbi:hypothetical protein [Bradyrhizobium sp. WSM1743]|uniref:hypothetical protein n=1 Tax=Bradyrhizobium sp. WSM1743 TaxID=318996 RepID=UPI00040AD062|nr:hypothetical protein [Bradyrhizobium sp. WSM1743]
MGFVASWLMADALLARAARAIEESRSLREQHRKVAGHYGEAVKELRLAIMDSAMLRSEIKARRDNEEP